MAKNYVYTVSISGQDWDSEYGWEGDTFLVGEEPEFGTYEEACEYVHSITTEQVAEWEKQTRCNGVSLLIYRDEFKNGMAELEFKVVGCAEWIGTDCNGMWL